MYNYFVVFNFSDDNGNGLGNTVVTRRKKIKTAKDVNKLIKDVEESAEATKVTILNFILL